MYFRTLSLIRSLPTVNDLSPDHITLPSDTISDMLWLPFLNHDTPVFTGAERIVRKMNNAVFYVDMERPERGKYICTFKRMSNEPGQLEEYELTRQFFQMLEETIRRAPQYYLWTHNRWKRTHEEYLRRNEHEGTGVRE